MKKIIVGALLFTLVGCGTKTDSSSTAIGEDAVNVSEDNVKLNDAPTERAVYRESEAILTDLVHTKLEVNFNWTNSTMNGIATITAKPHFYSTDSLILDGKGMKINSVKLDGNAMKFDYKDDFLRIHLNKVYTKDQKYTVVIDYVAQPETVDAEGSAAIAGAKGLYFINPTGEDKSKMPQIWTQGETESSSVWFPTIDSPNAKTTQEIFITVEDKYATLSNGKFIGSEVIDGKRTDHWKQDLPHAPYLFMMGIGEFKIVKDSYTRPDGTKMEVNYYVEPEWEEYARDIFGETPEMIRFFSERLGVEYPWDKYHQIVVRDYVSGAMENTGAVIFGDFAYKNKRELLDGNDQSTIAHELFHHWFGDLVTAESWSNLTLNESFANYSQYLWDEHRFGLDEADYQAEGEADGYYQSAQSQGYHDLVWFDYDDKEQMFDGHSYNKGGRILHMLRNYIGDDAFFEGIRRYLTDNKFKAAEFHHLRLAFEDVTGEDLNWFFNQWYTASGHPVLTFGHKVAEDGKSVEVTVEQSQDLDKSPIFKMPVQMAVFDATGKHVHKVVIDEVNQSFNFPISGELKGIHFDDQQMLLAKIKDDKSIEEGIFQFYNGERFAARRDGFMLGTKDKTQIGQQVVLDGLKDAFWNIRLLATGKMSRLKDESLAKGIAILKDMVANDTEASVRAAALNVLAKELKGEELSAIYKERISNDQSYSVVSTALKNYGKVSPEDAIRLAEPLEKEKSSKMISGLGQLYASFPESNKVDFFIKELNGATVQGFDKLGMLNSFTVYLTGQNPEVIEKAIPTYTKLNGDGGMYMKMFLPQNVKYLIDSFNASINKLNAEITKHEENNDAAYADQARAKIKGYEALIEKFGAIQ
ncbi:MAG: M1 family metallopeptidase [Crocinitomicaceae bacterium]